MQESKKKYLAKNTLLFAISSFGTKLMNFFLVPLYTNVLTTAEYGIADLIATTASVAVYIFTLDICSATLRFTMDEKDNPQKILWFSVKVNAIGCFVFSLALAVFYALDVFHWSSYCYFFLFLTFAFNSFHSVLTNYLRAIDKVKHVVICGLLSTAIIIVCNLLFLLVFDWQIVGYLLATIIASFFSCVYALCIIKPHIKNREKHNKDFEKAMLSYSIPLIFNGVCWWANTGLDKFFIKFMLGDAQNGLYGVAVKISGILTLFQTIFNQAWTLSAIKDYDKDDKDGFFTSTYNLYNAGMVLCCSLLITFNYLLAQVLFAKGFFEAWRISSILALTIMFSGLGGLVGSVFSAVKNSRAYATSTIISAVINAVLNYVLILWMGVEGAAVSTVISFIVVWAIRLSLSRKYIHMNLRLGRDIVAYVLLTAQVLSEHLIPHTALYFYPIQLAFVLILCLLYRSEIGCTVLRFVQLFKRLLPQNGRHHSSQ